MTGDEAKDLMQLQIWRNLVGEIDLLIAFEQKKFMSCKPEDLRAIQDRIMVYESVKNLPQNVADREE